MARQNMNPSSAGKDRHSKMSRPELEGMSLRHEKGSSVRAQEMDHDTPIGEIDGDGQAHELRGNHWKREMDSRKPDVSQPEDVQPSVRS